MPYTPQSWVTGDQVTAAELTDLSGAVTSASSGIADMSIDQSTSHLQVTLADGDLVDAGAVPAASDSTVAPILQNTASASYAAIAATFLDQQGNASGVRTIAPLTAAAGATDISSDIANAFATGVREVRLKGLPSSWYPVASTITVPAGKVLRVPENTTFYATADVDVFNVQEGAVLDGPYIQVNGVTGYSHAAIRLDGTATFGNADTLTTVRNVRIRGKAGSGATGTGILLDAGASGNFITFARFQRIKIWGTATAIELNSPASTYVNGNIFSDVVLMQPLRGLDLLLSPGGAVDGNYFLGVQVQTVAGMESVLLCQGTNNTFAPLLVWDWTSTVGEYMSSCTFADSSAGNQVSTNENGFRFADTGWGNTVHSTAVGTDGRKAVRLLGAPHGTSSPARYGNQDDWLTFAADRGDVTVTQTTGSAATAGSLSNLFNPDSSTTLTWADSGSHVVQATWAAALRGQVFGVIFDALTSVPATVACEIQKGGAWVQVLNVAANASLALEVSPMSPNNFGVTGVRWTFGGFAVGNTSSTIVVERIWMFESRAPGRAWASRHAPAITGTATTTAPAAGGGAALPATPTGYFTLNINGVDRSIAYY